MSLEIRRPRRRRQRPLTRRENGRAARPRRTAPPRRPRDRTRCHSPEAAIKYARGEHAGSRSGAPSAPTTPVDDARAPERALRRDRRGDTADGPSNDARTGGEQRTGLRRKRHRPSSWRRPPRRRDSSTRASPAAAYAASATRSTICACAKVRAASSKTSAVVATSSPTQYCTSSRSARVASRCAARRRHAACDSYAYARTSSLANTSQGTRCAALHALARVPVFLSRLSVSDATTVALPETEALGLDPDVARTSREPPPCSRRWVPSSACTSDTFKISPHSVFLRGRSPRRGKGRRPRRRTPPRLPRKPPPTPRARPPARPSPRRARPP